MVSFSISVSKKNASTNKHINVWKTMDRSVMSSRKKINVCMLNVKSRNSVFGFDKPTLLKNLHAFVPFSKSNKRE